MSRITLAILLVASLWGASAQAAPTEERPVATLRALDKVTARVDELDIPIEQPLKFGTIVITVRACRASPPEEPPESTAFVEVNEIKPDTEEKAIFKGWMYASSPALSAMEHPIYDLWLIGCKKASTN